MIPFSSKGFLSAINLRVLSEPLGYIYTSNEIVVWIAGTVRFSVCVTSPECVYSINSGARNELNMTWWKTSDKRGFLKICKKGKQYVLKHYWNKSELNGASANIAILNSLNSKNISKGRFPTKINIKKWTGGSLGGRGVCQIGRRFTFHWIGP